MPLSEEELRMLEQMERALSEEDPKFASTLRGTTMRQSARRKALLAGVGFTVGICVLMAGAITTVPIIGVAGFVIMLVSAALGMSAMKPQPARVPDDIEGADPDGEIGQVSPATASGFGVIDGGRKDKPRSTRRPKKQKSSGSFMERMEERWKRRREEGNGL